MKTEHTPTPWFIERRSVNDVRIVDENPNTAIAVMGNWLPEHIAERDANAALICRAVNSYADMLAALNKIVNNWSDLHPKDLQQARAAIRRAKGEG